jgi:putative hydrolase of the HAD superfamily
VIKVLIFDNNGVLTNSDNEVTISRFANYFSVDTEKLRPVFHKFAENMDDGSETTLQFYQQISEYCERPFVESELRKIHVSSYQPKSGMQDLLRTLKDKYQIALLTNFGDAFDEANQGIWNYNQLFDEDKLFVSCKLKMKKPDEEIYKYAINKLGIEPHEAIFIDDRQENIDAASRLGIKGILFKSPKQLKNELEYILENDEK